MLRTTVFATLLLAACGTMNDKTAKAAKACGADLGEVVKGNDVSEECRSAMLALLPGPEDNASARLFRLGDDRGAEARHVYLTGVDEAGKAIPNAHWASARVFAKEAGQEVELQEGADFKIAPIVQRGQTFLGLSLVTDYSASMREKDLAQISSLYGRIVDALPDGLFEGEARVFSEEVTEKTAFTKDKAALKAALAVDGDYERMSTAFHDGVAAGADALAARKFPARLLVVATDGRENASKAYADEAALKERLAQDDAFVVLIGSLFADKKALKELVGDRGVYVYAPDLKDAETRLDGFVGALKESVTLQIGQAHAQAEGYRIELPGGLSVAL